MDCVFFPADRGNSGPCVEIVLFVLFVHVLVHHPGVLHLEPCQTRLWVFPGVS